MAEVRGAKVREYTQQAWASGTSAAVVVVAAIQSLVDAPEFLALNKPDQVESVRVELRALIEWAAKLLAILDGPDE